MSFNSLSVRLVSCLAVSVLLTACGGMGGGTTASTVPMSSAAPTSPVLRVGDKIVVRLTGVPDGGFATEMEIPPSGELTLPLLVHPITAAGRTPDDLGADIVTTYKSQKIYSNPNVVVAAEDRYINVSGDVRGPGRVAYTPGLTLLNAINSCGGFTEYANKKSIQVIRGKDVMVVNAITATSTPGADPAVYPGDQIYVRRTMF